MSERRQASTRHVRGRLRVAFVGAMLLATMGFVAPVAAAVNSAVVNDIANPDAYTCGQSGFIDFEDLADGANLSSGAIGGVQFTTTSGYSWLVGDFGAGGYNGKYPAGAYTSKGTNWAWLGTTAGVGRIDFVNGPASSISLLTSALTPVSLEAYDASSNLLATAGPSANNTSTGHMDELKITRAVADIAYVVVHDSGNFFLVDAICTDAPGVGGPTEHAGTVPEPFACGTYVRGGENSGYQTDPATYDYAMPSPLGISGAGTFADHHWVHSTGTAFVVFDMGAPVPAAFYIPSIDHGPIPGEAIEATLYGTNNLADAETLWEAGTISDIYVQGVFPAWISDDYSTRWTFSQSYRYIGIIHGGPGAIVDDGDAEIDAVCAEGTRVTATKFYDANANGIQDNGETGIANWRISADSSTALTDATGQAAFVLQAGAHVVSEGTPVEANWFHTTPASVNIVVPDQVSVSFGNVCVGGGGALSKGFWGNKNGQALMNDGGGSVSELALLSGLNLRTATGGSFDPATYKLFNTWLQAANATNMAYMLSAQLAAMALNVEAGAVSGSSIVYGGSTLGFITINDLMAAANTELGLHGLTLDGSPYRAYQEALKDALDNNNKTFVQAAPCAFSFGA